MRKPPGPRGREVFGFFGRGGAAGTLDFLENMARRYGPVSYFRLLNQHVYLVDDPDLIQEILITHQHSFRRDTGATLLRELVGDGLLTREEPRHRERRRVLQPAFHRAQITAYAEIMVHEAESTAGTWSEDQPLNLNREMKRLTLSIVGSALFGMDFRQSADEIAAVLQRVVRKSSRIGPGFALLEPFTLLYRRLLPGGPSLFFQSERKQLEQIIEPIVRSRRNEQKLDIVSLLLNAKDETGAGLSEDDIRNEVITLVLAGHETTAAALTWMLYLLSTHPEVEEKLHRELDSVLGADQLTLDHLQRLPYTSMVVKESMRLYPPAILFGRRPLIEIELGGYRIPRRATIFVSPYITQRNERNFDHPDRFDPDRWTHCEPHKMAYFPFGAGAKMCIGDSFARTEATLVLAAIARRWRLEYAGEQPPQFNPGVLLQPGRPIMMKRIRRTMNELRQSAAGQYATTSGL